MLKSWFFFPLLGAFLFLQGDARARGRKKILLAWLFSALGVASISLWYGSAGALTYDGRLSAWYASPNFLAIALAPGILIAAYFLRTACWNGVRKNLRTICAFGAALALLLAAVFFTRSYGVWISVALALSVLLAPFFFSRAVLRKKLAIGMLLFIGIGTFVFFERGTEKWQAFVANEERSSLSSRMMIWQAAGKMLSDHPFSGIGIGRFHDEYLAYQKYFPPYLEWAVPEPHNLYAAVWLETGIVGLIGFSLLIGRLLFLLRRAYGAASQENGKGEAALLFSLFFLSLVYGLADTPYFKTDLAFSFWILVALSLSFIAKEKSALSESA
jgi:O-antigen ligase